MANIFSKLSFAGALLFSVIGFAVSEEYPSRIIRMINPSQAGGGIDITARLIQPGMSHNFGQKVIIVNVPGAAMTIGAAQVAHAPPDGYTFMISTAGPITITLLTQVTYDAKKDLLPISRVITAPFFLVVPTSSTIKTVSELIARGKDPKETISYGHPGYGTATHLASALFNTMAGANFVGIPYKGAAGQVQDTISAHLQFGFLAAPDAMSRLNQGMRPLAVSSRERSLLMPDLPTISEAGLPGYEYELWHGLFAPANTPRPIVERIREALLSALKDENIRSRLLALGMIPAPNTPEEFSVLVQSQMEQDAKLVKSLDLKM